MAPEPCAITATIIRMLPGALPASLHWTLPVLLLLAMSTADAQQRSAIAEIVSVSGTVEVHSKRQVTWETAQAGQLLYSGDTLRTGDPGLAVVLTSDGSGIHINRNSRFVLKEVARTADWIRTRLGGIRKSVYQLFAWRKGKPAGISIENENRRVDIEVETPTVKAGIRGTTLVLEVIPASAVDTSIVSVLEGSVEVTGLTGPRNTVIANAAQQAVAIPGQALRLRPLTISPTDSVQWTLYVPPLPAAPSATGAGTEYAQGLGTGARLLQSGQPGAARALLVNLTAKYPESPGAYPLLAITHLAMNDKARALAAAQRGVETGPDSPAAAVVLGYVYQSMFQLAKARAETERALALDPEYVPALTSLARLQFGEDDVEGARDTLQTAMALAPEDAAIHNLRGFILLARRDTGAAIEAFTRAVDLDPRPGEPHLGLGLAYMRRGDTDGAIRQIQTAVLLDPQRSLFRSYWGKMLHQTRRFDKALQVLERARELDPNDPTPQYYRAVILRDLNRPGEAIESFNDAVALNDNRAVYRSRFLLDRDLASRNVDLAILYNQLGLDAWARNRALASVKADYANFDGHLFYAGTLFELEGRSYSATSEALLSRMLQPANVNTFNNFNNYTSLFERPDTQATVEGLAGTQDTYGVNAQAFGAAPRQNLAYSLGGGYDHTDGWRGSNFEQAGSVAGIAKWQPTERDGVLVSGSWTRSRQGDANFPRFEADSPPRPDDRQDSTVQRFELGYQHQFAPANRLLLYGTYLTNDTDILRLDPLTTTPGGTLIEQERLIEAQRPFFQGQAHYTFGLPGHQVILGTLQYRGKARARDTTEFILTGGGQTQRLPFSTQENDLDIDYQSYYLQDIWHLRPWLTLEAAAYYDRIRNAKPIDDTTWVVDGFDPRIGLVVQPSARDTIRLAAFRYILPFLSPRLDPTDVAGIQLFRNTREGSRNTEFAAAWERQWTGRIFSSLNVFYRENEFTEVRLDNGREVERTLDGTAGGVELEYNQLLTPRIGLTGRYRYLEVDNDPDPLQGTLENVNRAEHLFRLGLRYVRPDGISAGIAQTVRHIDNRNTRPDDTAAITDVEVAYQFPGRRGVATLAVLNLFDDDFNWVTDRFVLQGRAPARQILFSLSWNL